VLKSEPQCFDLEPATQGDHACVGRARRDSGVLALTLSIDSEAPRLAIRALFACASLAVDAASLGNSRGAVTSITCPLQLWVDSFFRTNEFN
jgi:hypothetical protein